ncbi:MAG: hypothetical protein LJE95_13400 [Acidobacteria bacterium]|nr:hypothetical protein [Acidobacteriota bacterium]
MTEDPHLLCWQGGARIGWWDFTFPLARLSVRTGCLTLATTEKVFGFQLYKLAADVPNVLIFSPSDVEGLQVIGSIPVFSIGVRIHHSKPEYSPKVIFWTCGTRRGAEALVQRLTDFGFLPWIG